MSTETNIQTIEDAPRALAVNQVTPADLLRHAMDSGADLDRLEKLMDLQDRWEANEARKAFADSMAEFKKNPPTIYKDKQVSYGEGRSKTEYKHATIGNVNELVIASLASHGFSHRWIPAQRDGQVIVTCVITHRLGHKEETVLQSPPDTSGGKNGIQSIVSAMSYLERHSLLAACGLATKDQEDDDGQAANLDTKIADKWIAAARSATSASALQKVWADGEADIAANGTDFDRNDLVQAIEDRKNQLVKMAAREPTKSSRLKDIVGASAAGEES